MYCRWNSGHPKKQSKQKMILDAKTGKLSIHQVDVDHIIGWFVDGCTLQEAIETEVRLHGLEGKWKFDANKIDFDNM